ncbi:Sal-like protein 1, partial [Bulinus truncatus]
EFCPSAGVPSPDTISACDKCGVCFTDIAQYLTHKKLCATRSRILMPYDPPSVNGYIQNGYGPRGVRGKDYSDGEDDRDDYDSAGDQEDRPRGHDPAFGQPDSGELTRGRKRSREEEEEEDFKNDENVRYRPQIRPDENFLYGLKNKMIQSFRDKSAEEKDRSGTRLKMPEDDSREEDEAQLLRKGRKGNDTSSERSGPGGSDKEDPAIAWAVKAAERGIFGGNSNVTLEPLPATSAAVAQCGDRDEEVNMFRTMLFQLQQQQMMQIQMIQQMRRQLIASGVNPSMLPADIELSMMTSERLASVGAAMSGLQNANVAAAAVARDSMSTPSARYRSGSRSPTHRGHSRDPSPSASENSQRDPPSSSSPTTTLPGRGSEKDPERPREPARAAEERHNGFDITGKYLSPNAPSMDSSYLRHPGSSSPISRNPLEILQEKTAASLSSLPLSLGVARSSEGKSSSSSSSLLNSSALFASSPSLSALQKETDALKPSPILPPLSIPMTAEDYKGYIQRGTILERSQYASDDPFFKHKCRFCHKVFGSDSALQIHVRSHTDVIWCVLITMMSFAARVIMSFGARFTMMSFAARVIIISFGARFTMSFAAHVISFGARFTMSLVVCAIVMSCVYSGIQIPHVSRAVLMSFVYCDITMSHVSKLVIKSLLRGGLPSLENSASDDAHGPQRTMSCVEVTLKKPQSPPSGQKQEQHFKDFLLNIADTIPDLFMFFPGERPFKCNICGNRFSTKGNLKVHFERHKAKYPHIKMDATPVPEHLDRQPNLLPNFQATPLPSSVPLPPPLPRLPIPPSPHPPSPSSSSHPLNPNPSPFSFGGSFMTSPGMPPFGLMPPPRDAGLHFPHPLGLPLGFPHGGLARRESPNRHMLDHGLLRSPQKESPVSSNSDSSPSDAKKSGPSFPPYPYPRRDSSHRSDAADSEEGDSQRECPSEELHRRTPGVERHTPRSRHESEKSRSQSPASRKSSSSKMVTPSTPVSTSSPPPPLSRPSSSHSPRQSPASVISWASLTSSQNPLLPSHHPTLFSPHHPLPPGFPGLGLPMGGNPPPFHLPSPLAPMLPMSGPRLGGHNPFLHPPPPPPPQISSPPGEGGSMFRNSILPTKTIDPSENLEQYMEVQKSETSKLEALVKNIEQKITDPNQCVVCHRVLSCKSALQMHYRIHTGERPFKCKICGRSFTTKGNLKTHMGVHRAKPALRMMHQCPVCHKQFTNVLVLQQHIRAHTGSMAHMGHMPLLPPHMDWTHRHPFPLPRHHPYLPPMPHESLDLSRGPRFPHIHFPRERPPATDREGKHDSFKRERSEGADSGNDQPEMKHVDRDEGQESSPRPHSRSSDGCDDKERSSSRPSQQDSNYPKPNFESTILPPSFGNTPFDTPLAALEERVKAIDSQMSQTSFEKFRNSMGLDSTCFPNSSSSGASNGSEPTSKPESPASGIEMSPYGLLSPYDARPMTCNICLKTFACKSALDIHYRSHTKLKPFQCEICERSFSTRGNLNQHLLTHKIRDLPSSAFDENGEERAKDQGHGSGNENEEDDDNSELPNEDYPYEEDADEFGLDQEDEEDYDQMNDEDFDENVDEGQSSPKSFAGEMDENESNNNSSMLNMENHNDEDMNDESNAECSPEMMSNGRKDGLDDAGDSQDRDSPVPTAFHSQSANVNETNHSSSSSARRTSEHPGKPSSSSSHMSESSNSARRSGGPKHQCMTCMKPFSSASALQIHTRTHTGDKPFKCTVCSKAFTTRGNLKVHMGTHMWNNSPSRRGRRMSIEPPFLLSHIKDNPFMPAGFPPRPPPDFFYQYPLPMMNGPAPKMNEISVIQSLGGALPGLPPIPPHLMHGFLHKDEHKPLREAMDKKPPELDLSLKMEKDLSPTRSSTSTPISTQAPPAPPTFSSTPSPGNNKENSSSAAAGLDLRNFRGAPWMWGSFPCHMCGQMFPSQDALEHHARTHHMNKTDQPGHPMVKGDAHPPPKALLA